MVWLAFIVLIAAALVLLLRPLLRVPQTTDARSSELAVYRDQLKEVEADLARGMISASEAEAARVEIQRKMIAVAPAPEAGRNVQQTARFVRTIIAIAVPLCGAALYWTVGRPDLPRSEFTATTAAVTDTAPAAQQLPDVETMVARLAERLNKAPNDAQGWRMLGWSYAHLERHADAAKAFERAVALDGKNVALRSQYGEAVVRAAGGLITPQAQKIFDAALALDPKEPRARFFRGLALDQRNKSKEALDMWVKVIRDGPEDADWMPGLRQRATELALKLKIDPKKVVPGAASAPSTLIADTGNAAPENRHDDLSATVDELSKRLESNPKDYQGWILLARSYKSLGKIELGRAALARAREIFASAPFVLQQIATTESELAVSPSGPVVATSQPRGPTSADVAAASQLSPAEQNTMIEGMVVGLERRLHGNPNDLDGWLMLARSRKVLGDTNAARTALGRAEELFRSNAQARARIAQVASELQLN